MLSIGWEYVSVRDLLVLAKEQKIYIDGDKKTVEVSSKQL